MREGPQPGDIGAVVRLHGLLYAREFGLDASFEAMVARRLGELTGRGWPAAGEGLWIAERDGEPAGSITLAAEGDGLARLGHFLLHPDLRGQGLGPRLVDAALERAREADHRRIELLTFSELGAAARIYRAAGFERVSAEPRSLWGREIKIETYELAL
ncbi:MAG: GNAT family N-acetyltransferase [Thermoleophilaceae bacterium]|nr:GNAT family N-acetyltransferase [Thermoleophilaceae bacterium]